MNQFVMVVEAVRFNELIILKETRSSKTAPSKLTANRSASW